METTRAPKICVVGAGIMGMSSAYILAQSFPGSEITIYAKDLPPNTTSNFGYGIVFCRGYDAEMYCPKIGEWSGETTRFCTEMTKQGLAEKAGIKLVDGYLVLSKSQLTEMENNPAKESIAYSASLRATCTYFRESTKEEVQERFLSKNTKFDVLLDLPKRDSRLEDLRFYSYGTYIIDTDLYLLWLWNELFKMGKSGFLRKFHCASRNMHHLMDLIDEDFDLVINCSGLGAKHLALDNLVTAIRAQYFLVRAPHITNLYYAGRTCICPRPGRVALGSVFQWDRYDMDIDPAVTKDNWDRAKSLFPELQETQILGEYVRLRPGRRGGARLEYEKMINGAQCLNVIHNYGHAGTGIGQHWGCALDVVKMAKMILPRRSRL